MGGLDWCNLGLQFEHMARLSEDRWPRDCDTRKSSCCCSAWWAVTSAASHATCQSKQRPIHREVVKSVIIKYPIPSNIINHSTAKKSTHHFLTGWGTYSSSSFVRFLGSIMLTETFRDSFCDSIAGDVSPAAETVSDFTRGSFVIDFSMIPSSSNSSAHAHTLSSTHSTA